LDRIFGFEPDIAPCPAVRAILHFARDDTAMSNVCLKHPKRATCEAAVTPANSPPELGRSHAPLVPFHAAVLELRGTGGTNGFYQRLLLARRVGLIIIQAME
jgi:hypothetical protein